eukprot:m.26766 g.26766  ORF g.26766 m.26766 type:complete len:53 (+) comp5884_c0_seq2:140-298(+)
MVETREFGKNLNVLYQLFHMFEKALVTSGKEKMEKQSMLFQLKMASRHLTIE